MDKFVPDGLLTFGAAVERVAAVLNVDKGGAQRTLRQLLYGQEVSSLIIENSGQNFSVPAFVWGGTRWAEALKSGEISIEVAAYAPEAHGAVFIPENHLLEALKSRVPQKIETATRDAEIYEKYRKLKGSPRNLDDRDVFELMKKKNSDLLRDRRTRGDIKMISWNRFMKIIREQRPK